MDRPANLVEPYRAAPLAQQLHNQHGPFVPDAGQRLANHGALAHVPGQPVIFKPLAFPKAIRRPGASSNFDAASRLDTPGRFDAAQRLNAAAARPHRLINVTGFQISAFLRVPPIVTILALVTKRNQAT